MSPKVALIIFTLFLVGYIAFIDEEGGFTQDFLKWGPSNTRFLGVKLDSWHKVIMMYLVGFTSALMTTYYRTVMSNNIHSYIWNRALESVPYSKTWTYIIVMLEPFFYQVLEIIQFFTTLTMQFQFIVPQFVGGFLADIPFTLQRLGEKRFDQL